MIPLQTSADRRTAGGDPIPPSPLDAQASSSSSRPWLRGTPDFSSAVARAASCRAVHRLSSPVPLPNVRQPAYLGCSFDSGLFVSHRNIPYRLELNASVVSASHEDSPRSL